MLPGQFVTAMVHTAQQQRLAVVPAAAIQRTRDGVKVYVVDDDDDRVVQRTVELGPKSGTGYAVTSGLQNGEIVVVFGIQKVDPGEIVRPVREGAAGAGGKAPAAGKPGEAK